MDPGVLQCSGDSTGAPLAPDSETSDFIVDCVRAYQYKS